MREGRPVLIVIAALVIAAEGFFVYRRTSAKKQAGAQREQAAQAAARAIPVIVAPVQRRDVPLYLDGLGNVSAFYTVTVRSQVGGRLDQGLFPEGQQLKKRDPLPRIGPGPFQ